MESSSSGDRSTDRFRPDDELEAELAAQLGSEEELELGPENADDYVIVTLAQIMLEEYALAVAAEEQARTLGALIGEYGIVDSASVNPAFVDFLSRLGYDNPDKIQSLCEYAVGLKQFNSDPAHPATTEDLIKTARLSEAAELINKSTEEAVPYLVDIGVNEAQLRGLVEFGSDAQKKLIRQARRILPGFPELVKELKDEASTEPLEFEDVVARAMEAMRELDKKIAAIDEGDQEVTREVFRELLRDPRTEKIMRRLMKREELITKPVLEEEHLPDESDEDT